MHGKIDFCINIMNNLKMVLADCRQNNINIYNLLTTIMHKRFRQPENEMQAKAD
jgi:hypothetical protein